MMLKKTRGYILLTLLVLTGFAGQVSNQTISSTERSLLVTQLKTTKAALLQSLSGLSDKQLTFRPAKGTRSIAEELLWLEASQKQCIATVDAAVTKSSGPAPCLFLSSDLAKSASVTTSAKELPDRIKNTEAYLVKYAKTTTENLHAHPVQTPAGTIDAYQALLQLPILTQNCLTHIENLRKDRQFPRL
ncbi:MAG: hypothetical protein JWP88_11 [Flaviaesturariibacter sp.]|nr:hypothetical protein [Flaviaesturariibacter sp.]